MNTATANPTVKQCLQRLKDEQLQHYHRTHDCFTGQPLTPQQQAYFLPEEEETDPVVQKKQRDLDCLNEVLYPPPTLGSVLGASLAALKREPAVIEPVVSAVEKPSANLLNRAKHWFNTYQSTGLEALLPTQSSQLTEANIQQVKQAFSANTLLIRNVCLLSSFWIRNPLDWDEKGDTGFLEHLFVQYETPAFLRACWSEATDEENIRWLLCFIMYAQGGSLKALANYFDWTTASSKLWHQLYQCPANMTPQHAVLYAEFKRLGGWDEDFACLMENEAYVIDLLEPVSEAGRDFWYDTCRWLINLQHEMTPAETRKVLWWARHQLAEHNRRGETYRLQGRSKARVLDSIADYEREQYQIEQARARLAERARQVSMAREEERARLREEYQREQEARAVLLAQQQGDYYDIEPVDVSWNDRHWNWETRFQGKRWTFKELTSTQALIDEGDAMEHCVGSYSLSCFDGYSAIFSLRCESARKVTIEVNPRSKVLVQVQGQCNAEPPRLVQTIVNAWMARVVK